MKKKMQQFSPFLDDIFLDEIFNVMNEGILIIDTAGDIVFANTAYIDFIKLSIDQVIGKHLRDLRPHARLPEIVKSGKAVLHAQRLEGLEEAYFVNMYPLWDGDQVVGGLSVITFLDDASKVRQELEVYEHHSKQILNKVNRQNTGYTFDDIIAVSTQTLLCKQQAMKLAGGDMTVLLQSESGTGKELYAQSLHNASPRAANVFLAVNCANFNESILDSELFGYVDGSFTGAKKGGKIGLFEAARGGTLFLDEIGEMALGLQAKLLRALQENKIRPIGGTKEIDIDVRIICATNVDLEKAIEEGRFRKDLYYRLNAFTLHIPTLRERPEDMPLLIDNFLSAMNRKYHRHLSIDQDAVAILQNYDWPGNIRELRNVIEYSAYICEGDQIIASSLPDGIVKGAEHDEKPPALAERVHRFERMEINAALKKYGDTLEGKKAAAAALGISLASLYNKLKA